jgi:hypothetical protein
MRRWRRPESVAINAERRAIGEPCADWGISGPFDLRREAVMARKPGGASCNTTLAERDGQARSRSISSRPLRKQQTSSNSPPNSGPAASSA